VHLSHAQLLLVAVPAVAASMAVLTFGAVGRSAWIIQVLAISLACALAFLGAQLSRRANARFPAAPIIVFTLLGIAIPLLGQAPGPERWASMGPINLYMAPALLPSFLLACSAWITRGGRSQHFAFTAVVAASVLLAAQPDASQALALLAASAVAVARSPSRSPVSVVALVLAALATAWAFSQPDPLQPVAHVEGVFALALAHSLFAGAAVIASAAALVVGLHVSSPGGRTWLSAVAVYYAVLFACSVAGLTPAPLIGYGAGPWLGFGLMVAVASALDAEVRPNDSSKPTPRRDVA
jgi:cell division protein FtsW (lipid II flippase)